MPDIFICSFKRAESYGDTQEALATPQSTGGDEDLPDGLTLAGIDSHCDLLLNISLQQMLEGVIILVKPGVPNGHHEIEECLQASFLSRGCFLDSEHMIALGTSPRNFHTLASSHLISSLA